MKKETGIFALLVLLCIFVSWQNPLFLSPENLSNTARLIGLYGILAIGVGLVIITGGIDLSVGSVMALLGVTLAMALREWRWPWALAASAVLVWGIALGALHGFLITKVRLQPFIVTLCGLLFYRGVARYVARDETKGFGDEEFAAQQGFSTLRSLASGDLFGVPATFVLLIVVAAVIGVLLHGSVWGRHLYAVGRNEDAARYSGINSRRVITTAYILCTLLAALAAILDSFYTNSLSPSSAGQNYELYAIAAAVLGGCSLRGGEGSIAGILIGAALLVVLRNLINLLKIQSSLEFAVIGAVILLGVLADQLLKNRAAQSRSTKPTVAEAGGGGHERPSTCTRSQFPTLMPLPKYFPSLLAAALAVPAAAQAPPDEATRNAEATKLLREHAPLKTRWAADVSQTSPHPEYPRPQMVRPRWKSLNGQWQFQDGLEGQAAPVGQALREKILVPFAMESQLSGIQRHAERSWYRRVVSIPTNWRSGRVLLHFGAVDWEARVWVNGQPVGTHRGGFDPFSFDITSALKAGEDQEVIVAAYDPTDRADIPRGKQVLKPGGIFYTPASGIWQSVWAEPVSSTSIESLKITPDVDNGVAWLRVSARGLVPNTIVEAVTLQNGRALRRVSGAAGRLLMVPVPKARLWTPDTPHLYGLRISLKRGKKTLDSVSSYFAMRKIELKSDGRVLRPLLNGRFVFQMGALDQGYWPDGLLSAPTDEALRYDVEIAKKLGFNLLRKHAKTEPARWYYHCDRLGMLVWQDMPQMYNQNPAPEWKAQFQSELTEMVRDFEHFPSIVVWTLFNEGWGQHDTERLTAYLRGLDSTRLLNNASGWTDKNVGDLIDTHAYPPPQSPQPEPKRAAVLGEYGGLGMRAEGHMWKGESWGYQGLFSSGRQLTRRYEQYQKRIAELRLNPGLSAAVYTQLTDVEVEANGLLSYDRAVIKADLNRIAAANRFQFRAEPPSQVLVATSEATPQTWRYTFDKPGDNWASASFDDSAWKSGPGGFGTEGTPGAIVRTTWNTSDIWARRSFEWKGALPASSELLFRVIHDEDIEIYLNGVLAAKASGHTGTYEELEVSPAARAALKSGTNTLAIHVRQTGGGQSADVGLVAIGESPRR